MNMIEVDPKLFVKCRLCLDETGQYQIVPNVQMQIKYCFDIDVEPFDGLPQLVCKKCESILSQYAGIKQIFQEKQKNLKSKLISNAKNDTIFQQQQDTVTSTQTDTEHKNKLEENTRLNRVTPVPTRRISTESETSNHSHKKYNKSTQSKHSQKTWQTTYKKSFVCRFCAKSFKDIRRMKSHIHKKCRIYTKYSNINKAYCLVRLNKMGEQPNCTGSLDNVVINKNKIIQSREATFYVLYANQSPINCQNDSSESDEDFIASKRVYKRRRLISRSSNETIVIEQNATKNSDDEKVDELQPKKIKHTRIVSDIDCVNIDDSDSNSTKSSEKMKNLDSEAVNSERINTINDKMVNNIIAMCLTKYMNRLNASEGGNPSKGKEDSSLKHKILSIGRKVVCSSGISTTGLLRYMEHKSLEVVWFSKIGSKVIIKTRSKESGDSDKSNFGWENITSLPNHNHAPKDFVHDFERILALEDLKEKHFNQVSSQCVVSNTETSGNSKTYFGNLKENQTLANILNSEPQLYNPLDNAPAQVSKIDKKANDNVHLRAVLDADKNWTKLLNANPVANPKQLPKKNTFNEPASMAQIFSNELQDSEIAEQGNNIEQVNDVLHMPIITSTVSLAPIDKEQANVDSSKQNENKFKNDNSTLQSTGPKIKVKPVSELMPEKAPHQNNIFTSTTGWTVNKESQNQNVVMQSNTNNMVYIANESLTNVIPLQQDILYYTEKQNVDAVGFNPIVNHSGAKQLGQRQELVKLHTVDLPNTITDSPFRYFKNLLQVHNIHLLYSEKVNTSSLNCLMKFKVVFEQESNLPVRLCLLLLCEKNVFCIKVMDDNQKDLDISQFSANWQWEILRVFIGEDIVPKLLANSLNFSNALYNQTAYFTNLLRSIVFSKES